MLGPKRATAQSILANNLATAQESSEMAAFPPTLLRPILAELGTLLRDKKTSVAVAETVSPLHSPSLPR